MMMINSISWRLGKSILFYTHMLLFFLLLDDNGWFLKHDCIWIIPDFLFISHSLASHRLVSPSWSIQRLPELCRDFWLEMNIPYFPICVVFQVCNNSVSFSFDSSKIVDVDDVVLASGKYRVIFEIELVG